jgi:hypothetical protein
VVDGYHRTEKERGRGSPIVIFVLRVCEETEYAEAASMVPGLALLGAACTRRFT